LRAPTPAGAVNIACRIDRANWIGRPNTPPAALSFQHKFSADSQAHRAPLSGPVMLKEAITTIGSAAGNPIVHHRHHETDWHEKAGYRQWINHRGWFSILIFRLGCEILARLKVALGVALDN
jgi:hypothetical protein